MISGWNEAGRWLDLSVHRFKFRLDQTRRLGPRPRSQPASSSRKPIADRIIISPHLLGGGGGRPPSYALDLMHARILFITRAAIGPLAKVDWRICVFRIPLWCLILTSHFE